MKQTSNGKKGGTLKGKPHSKGGIKAVVGDNKRPVELEGGEVIINKEASKKHWKELSRINQSAGGGVPIENPNGYDDNPSEEYKEGGVITFNKKHLPNKNILKFAEKLKSEHKDIWDKAGNIYGNEAFKNLNRVSERGYWLDSEEWFYKKWRSYVARHKKDFRLKGTIAMIKWVDEIEKGWAYMKKLVEEEIAKKSKNKMSKGGSTNPCWESHEMYGTKTKNGKRVPNCVPKKEEGGNIHKDLFEHYEEQPEELSNIVNKYMDLYVQGEMDYKDTAKFREECENIGYTFDFYLDNEPYALRPVGVEINQLQGWEDFEKGGKVIHAPETYEDGDLMDDFKKGGTPQGRHIVFKNEDVILEHNEVSDKYSLIDAKTKSYIMECGGNTKYSFGGRLEHIKKKIEKEKTSKEKQKEREDEYYRGYEVDEREAIKQTEELAKRIFEEDFATKLKANKELGEYFEGYDKLIIKNLGWKFNWGRSKEWAGLCSAEEKGSDSIAKSKNKNIYASLNFARHDKNWKTEVEQTLYHEVAHAIVREAFNPMTLREIDPDHFATGGHGMVFKEVCKTITGSYCPTFYHNADFKDSIKNWKYFCRNCGNKQYGSTKTFASKCSNCGKGINVTANIS